MIKKLHGSGGNSSHTFDRIGPDGSTLTADELARATATNLHGEFARVVSTADILASIGRPGQES